MLLAAIASLGPAGIEAQEPPQPPPRPVMVYQRRPLKIPVACRAEDFERAGIECSEEDPCKVFLELTGIEAVGPKVLLVGNLHTASATLASVALLSEDAGSAWREPTPRTPATGFESVQFLNEQQGWIAAQPQEQLAVDPYLLATADGGATWQKMPIWSEEGRAGVLQQFYFNSKDHGFALIDRSQLGLDTGQYELYETPNGGLSWMLRESSSKPIAPKWTARRAAEWRLREDGKAKTYDVERSAGRTWQKMSSFATELAVCRALEPSHPPAPPAAPERIAREP